MARRAGCGVAAKGGVIDGCYAAYTTSVTPIGVPASPQGEALGTTTLKRINNHLHFNFLFCGDGGDKGFNAFDAIDFHQCAGGNLMAVEAASGPIHAAQLYLTGGI